MKIGEIEGASEWIGTFRPDTNASLDQTVDRRVELLPWTDGSPAMLASPENGQVWHLQPLDMAARTLLLQNKIAGPKSLISVVAVRDSTLVLRAQGFNRCLQFPDSSPLMLLVTEAVESTLPASAREMGILAFLQTEFVASDVAFAIVDEGDFGAMRLVGSRFVLDLKAGRLGHLQTKRLEWKRREVPGDRITLLRGAIAFQDARIVNSTPSLRVVANRLQAADTSFFSVWKIYQDLTETLVEQQKQEAGSIHYSRFLSRWEDGALVYVFTTTSETHPIFLREDAEVEALQNSSADDESHRPAYVGTVASRKPSKELVVVAGPSTSDDIPPKGILQLSQSGDRVMLSRRKRALDLLQTGQTQLPTLATLLEQGDAPVAQPRTWEPFSDRVRRVLPNPTPQQKRALDVALNTPDMALIQGPPGTGKTSVIRALMTRLAELQEIRTNRGDTAESAAVLVTSEQHDAVQNAVDGFDAGGLPVFRYSRRRGETQLEERELDRWVAARIAALQKQREMHGTSPARMLGRKAERLILRWREAEKAEERLACINELIDSVRSCAPPNLMSGLIDLKAAESPATPPPSSPSEIDNRLKSRLNALVAAQPMSNEQYASNGLLQSGRLLDFIEKNCDILQIGVPEQLRAAAMGKSPFEGEQGSWQEMLTGLLSERPDTCHATDQCRPNEDGLLDSLLEFLRSRAGQGTDGILDALEAFAEELEDPVARRSMIEKYARVVAATCQQSVSKAYANGLPDFEYVIVDEAARANPLDLLVPLSRGKRIILVGDHRQLPQMLEPEVLEQYRVLHPTVDERLLQQSLFERLFGLFITAEQNGGPCRSIMLTDDFRMHPALSAFVSELFYSNAVTSRCESTNREHGLSFYGTGPFSWIDLPSEHGIEEGGQSKRRAVEARTVVKEVERILASNAEFSVGVITFYERQAALLGELCGSFPFDWQNRVRVGTVDAFQGREFDVVVLSTVRSNNETSPRRRVGFLAYPNRLCVAFSRAKRLLITVGDAVTVAGTDDNPIIPEFHALLKACRGAGGYYEHR